MSARGFLALCLLMTIAVGAQSSGMPILVEILRFEWLGDTSYTLVVRPKWKKNPRPSSFLGPCKEFVVHGEFKQLRVVSPSPTQNINVTKASHIRTMQIIEYAFRERQTIALGYFNGGFERVDRKNPCEVKSRALTFDVVDSEVTVWSYHDAT
jgi:hypothetical protein